MKIIRKGDGPDDYGKRIHDIDGVAFRVKAHKRRPNGDMELDVTDHDKDCLELKGDIPDCTKLDGSPVSYMHLHRHADGTLWAFPDDQDRDK